MEGELKIVILIKGEAASIGVQALESDPVFVLLNGDLPAILAKVPEVLETAKEKWATSPRYPKCALLETVQAPQQAANAVGQTARNTATPKTTPQPNMF